MNTSFDVVIASKGESENLKVVLPEVLKFSKNVIVVLDKEDQDDSISVCEKFPVLVVKQKNHGKGDALRVGAAVSSSDILVFIDADGSHDPSYIPNLIKPIIHDSIDLVVASRMLGGSDELFCTPGQFIRLCGSHLITLILNRKFNVNMTDSQNGFRAIRRNLFLDLNLKERHTTIEQEMTAKVLATGHSLLEIRAHEYARRSGTSKIKVFKHGWRYALTIFTYIFLKRSSTKTKNLHPLDVQEKYNLNWL